MVEFTPAIRCCAR